MNHAPAVLLADRDEHSRESLINQLMVAGVKEIGTAASTTEVVDRLASSEFDVLVVDYALFCELDGDRILDRYRAKHHSRVILLVDEDHDDLVGSAARARRIYMCILKSTAGSVLRSVLVG